MAPVFGDQTTPRKAAGGNTFSFEKPAFIKLNAPTTSQSNGFFRIQELPTAPQQHQQQTNVPEDDWDMGDDRSDGSPIDMNDSQALTFDDGDLTHMDIQPELVAFAARLDDSKLLREAGLNPEEAADAAYGLIQAYQAYAGEHIEETAQVLEELENRPPEAMGRHHAQEVFHTKETLKYWELEHQTWELFGALVSHRLSSEGHAVAEMPIELATNRYACDGRIRNYFFNSDPSFRELTIVLEWLRRYSPAPTADDIEANPLYRVDGGWIYTKEKIKAIKRLRPGNQVSIIGGELGNGFLQSARDEVTELDPDAPSRQQRSLQEEDAAWERYLMKLVWGFLRKGELHNAQDLCEDAGEFWRAASLSGGVDAWDTRIDGPRSDGKEGVEGVETDAGEDFCVTGNRRRELWKRMCYAIARRKGGDMFEQAVYGTLCGDIESVLPICETWEDLLFVHVNALVEGHYSSKLANLSRIPAVVSRFPSFDAVAYHSRQTKEPEDSVMPRIVDEIASNDRVPDSKLPLRSVQGALISLRFHDLVMELDRQLRLFETVLDYDPELDEQSNSLDATEPRLLRVIVHVLMVLQTLDVGFQPGSPYHSAAENVIAGYVSTLGEFDKFELVPLYASRLSSQMVIKVVGKSLAAFEGDEIRREELIRSMHLHGIDVDGCLKQAMERSLKMTEVQYATSMIGGKGFVFKGFTGDLYQEDRQLIRGLEWLTLGSDALQGELVRRGCEVYKRFLLTGRLAAAKVLYTDINSKKIIPPTEVNSFATNVMDMEGNTAFLEDGEETQLAAAVYLHMEGLIEAMIALEQWQTILAKRPERADRSFGRRLKPYYEEVLRTLPGVVKTFLDEAPLLALTGVPDIRAIYVPEMVISLHRVHVEAGNAINKGLLMNALELAADVADPDRNILYTFKGTGRLEEYVEEIAAASRNILGATQDGAKDLGIWTVAK